MFTRLYTVVVYSKHGYNSNNININSNNIQYLYSAMEFEDTVVERG